MTVFTYPYNVHYNVLDDAGAEFAHYYSMMLHPEYYGKGKSPYKAERSAYGEGTYGRARVPEDLKTMNQFYENLKDEYHESYEPDPRDFIFPGEETYVYSYLGEDPETGKDLRGDYLGRFNTRVTGESPGEDIVREGYNTWMLSKYPETGILFDVSEYEKDPSNYPIVATDESFTHQYAEPLVRQETLNIFDDTFWTEGPIVPGADAPIFQRYRPPMDWELEEMYDQ